MATLTNRMETSPASLGTNEIREDLRDVIADVSPVETPLFSMAGSVAAKSVKHEWMNDSLAAESAAGHGEGVAHTSAVVTRPSRVENWCQILRKDYSISDTQEAVDTAGFSSSFNFQTVKALKEVARNTEMAMIQSTAVTTNSAATPMAMDGLATFIQTNVTTNTALAASLMQANLSALQEVVFDSSGLQPNVCLLSATHKRAVSTFYTSITKEVGNVSKTLGQSIMSVVTDFGDVNFVMTRYGRTINATTKELYLFPRSQVNKAWLMGTKAERQARDGDITPGMVMHQLTLEVLNEASCGRMSAGLTVTYS